MRFRSEIETRRSQESEPRARGLAVRATKRARGARARCAALACAASLAVLDGGAAAAADLAWSGQVRLRAEGFDRTLEGRAAQWDIFQRVRIGLSAQVAPDVLLFVQAQDSRVWGEERNTLGNLRSLDLHQAYGELQRSLRGANLRLRAGRQELAYGDERVIGPLGWHNVARSFDALQLRVQHGPFTADLVGARLADTVFVRPPTAPPVAPNANDDLFVSYNRLANAAGTRGAEAYAMYRASADRAFETTLGERLFGALGRFRAEQELAVMVGRRNQGDLEAFLFTGQLYARVLPALQVGAGVDVVSGDDPRNASVQLFDTNRIFATAHKFYGVMDVAELLAGKAGLVDSYALLAGTGPRGIGSRLEVHFFRVHEPNAPGTPAAALDRAALGTEVDGIVSLPVSTRTTFELGGAMLVPGTRLEKTGRGQNAFWTYAQGLFNF